MTFPSASDEPSFNLFPSLVYPSLHLSPKLIFPLIFRDSSALPQSYPTSTQLTTRPPVLPPLFRESYIALLRVGDRQLKLFWVFMDSKESIQVSYFQRWHVQNSCFILTLEI